MSIQCEVCDKGPQDGVTVYRTNEKGVAGIWRCAEHEGATDPETQEIIDAIEGK